MTDRPAEPAEYVFTLGDSSAPDAVVVTRADGAPMNSRDMRRIGIVDDTSPACLPLSDEERAFVDTWRGHDWSQQPPDPKDVAEFVAIIDRLTGKAGAP